MSKISLTPLADLQNETTAVGAINSNNEVIQDAIDNSLWRTGSSPNAMGVTLDMNSNRIINLPEAVTDFEPVRLEEFNRALFDATTVVLSYGLSNGLNFDTRAAVQATNIPLTVNYITISKYATSYPRCDAPYVRGGTVIPIIDASGHQWGLDLSSGIANAYWFGVKADGVTDDTFAMQTAVNNCASATLYVKGLIGLTSFVSLPSDITLEGLSFLSGFKALGTNSFSKGLLFINNKTSVRISKLTFIGNLVEPVPFASGAIRIELDTVASADMENISITKCSFRSFKTSEWIGVFLQADSANVNRLIGLDVSDNYVNATQDCVTTLGNGNSFLQVFANGNSTSPFVGDVSNVSFHNNKIVGLGLGGALACFFNTHEVSVRGNTTINMGNYSAPTDRAYTYLFYNSNPALWCPFNISIIGNTGYGHHNNAVYLAGAMNATVSGNSFEFVYPGGLEPSLPWGAAIAINGTRNVTVTGNTLTDALGGIAYVSAAQPVKFAAGFNADTHNISNNSIFNSTAISSPQAPYGILISGVDASPTSSDCIVSGNIIRVTPTGAVGILVRGVYVGHIRLSDNLIEARTTGIGTEGTVKFSALELLNNRVFGSLETWAMDINADTGAIYATDNIADFSAVLAGSSGGVRISGPEAYIDGLVLHNKTNASDAVVLSSISTGTLRNVSFPKTTSNYVSSGSLGYASPTFAGVAGDFVQNIATFAEQGSTGSKYVLQGWTCLNGTTWLQNRALTGN